MSHPPPQPELRFWYDLGYVDGLNAALQTLATTDYDVKGDITVFLMDVGLELMRQIAEFLPEVDADRTKAIAVFDQLRAGLRDMPR